LGDLPDNRRYRSPLPKEQDQGETGEKHVGAALDGGRHNLRPPALEGLPRHHAVLHCKQRKKQAVNNERFTDWHDRSGIKRLWHSQTGYEADGPEERAKKDEVGGGSVDQCKNASHYCLPTWCGLARLRLAAPRVCSCERRPRNPTPAR